MTQDIQNIQEQMAHLQRLCEDLSDIVADQEKQITRLNRRVEMLLEREAERELSAGGTVPLADQKPPHW